MLSLPKVVPLFGSSTFTQVRGFAVVHKKIDQKKEQQRHRVETPQYVKDKKQYPITSTRALKIVKKERPPPPPKPLRFPLQDIQSPNPEYYPPQGNTSGLPFQFTRTLSNQLPVYRDYRFQRSKIFTVIRKYMGSSRELAEELSRLIPGVKVIYKAGSVELEGDYTSRSLPDPHPLNGEGNPRH